MLSFATKREKREAVIRSSLLERLKDSVQSLIYGPGGENVPRLSSSSVKGQVLGHTDNTNALCSIIEAIIIHGLKDSLGERLSSMFLGDLDRMPVPNFWLVVMVISHRDLIEQVSALSFIMTDVGKGRAWLRLVLNEGQLISYLSILAGDVHTLKDYYRPTALLHDVESCDIMLRILQPLAGISFNLATNAAVLNTWTQTPLVLSGTWMIPAKYDQSVAPVLSGTDVASTFRDSSSEEEAGVPIPQAQRLSDQMFDLIIGGTPETHFINVSVEGSEEEEGGRKAAPREEGHGGARPKERRKRLAAPALPPPPPTVATPPALDEDPVKRGDDEDIFEETTESGKPFEEGQGDREESTWDAGMMNESTTSTASDRGSVFTRSVSVVSDTNEYRNLLSDWEASSLAGSLPAFLTAFQLEDNSVAIQKQVPQEEEEGFEIVSPKLSSEEEMSSFLPMLTVLMNEQGLDYQEYQCNSSNCSVPIGMIYGKPRLCKYDGKYYCYECHLGDTSVIPARVLHNWEFTAYPVCAANKKWLDTVSLHPMLDIRLVNPKLYNYVSDLSELQVLRLQLHLIQAYLFTCSSDKGHELRKTFWPREHLYEHVHLYSIQDLMQTQAGKLLPVARQAVASGRSHILKCQLCSARGFICEVCRDDAIIYPFQLGDTFTCGSCSGVFHKRCVQRQSECPKCRRRDARMEAAAAPEDSDI